MIRKRNWTRGLCGLLSMLFLLPLIPVCAAEGDASLGTGTYFLAPEDDEGHRACETDLGSFAADAVRWFAQADAALIPAGDLGETLQAGEITREALARSFPEDRDLVTATVTGSDLYALLNFSVSRFELLETERIDWEASEFDGFLHLSGLKVTYDYSANPGNRVYRLTDESGAVIQNDTLSTYTLATTRAVTEGVYGETGISFASVRNAGTEQAAVAAYIADLGEYDAPGSGRIKIIGTKEYTIIRRMPAVFLVLLVALFAGFNGLRSYRKRMKYER